MSLLFYPLVKAMLLCALMGAAIDLIIDAHLILPALRWCYRLGGGKDEPPRGSWSTRGIVRGRKTASLVTVIIVFSLGIQAYRITYYHVDLLEEFLMLLLDVPSIIFGVLVVAPFIHGLFVKNKDSVYRGIDKIREGDVGLGKLTDRATARAEEFPSKVAAAVANFGSSIRLRWRNWYRPEPQIAVRPVPTVQEPQSPSAAAESQKAKGAFERYVGGTRGN